jgi:microcompartment protein CcmK/EutM
MKKLVSTLALTSLLVVGTAGVASAQTDPTAPPAAEGEHARPRHRPLRHAAKVAAEAIGISTEELKAELQAGKSVAQVAEEHGVAVDSVVAAIVHARTAKAQERAEKFVNHQFGTK